MIGEIPRDGAEPLPWPWPWWSSDGKLLVLVHEDGDVALWRVAKGRRLGNPTHLEPEGAPDPPLRPGEFGTITSVAFSRDHRSVVVVHEAAGTATVFNTDTGRRIRVVQLPENFSMPAAAISPDGRTLAVSAAPMPRPGGGAVELYDIETGERRGRIPIPYPSDGLAFARNGRAIVTMNGGAGTIQLWDTTSQRRMLSLPLGAVIRPFFQVSPDGRRVVLATNRGDVVVWDVGARNWEARACQLAGRALTRAEWRTYLPGYPYDPACRR